MYRKVIATTIPMIRKMIQLLIFLRRHNPHFQNSQSKNRNLWILCLSGTIFDSIRFSKKRHTSFFNFAQRNGSEMLIFRVVVKCRRNVSKALEDCVEEEKDLEEVVIVPELDEKDKKSYETVQKIIKGFNNIVFFFFNLHVDMVVFNLGDCYWFFFSDIRNSLVQLIQICMAYESIKEEELPICGV